MLRTADLEPIKAAVVSSSLDAIVVIDDSGAVLAWNPAAETLFGYSQEEAVGRPVAELIVPENLRGAHKQGFEAYLAGRPARVLGKRVETQASCKDGRIIPVEITILEIGIDDRRMFTANIRDRSDDAARDEELEDTRRQLHLAVQGADLGVWTFNPTNGALWYSERSRQLIGLGPDDVLDVPTLRARVHPDDWERLSEPYYQGFPHETLAIEYRVIRPDGELRWIYALGAAERDAAGIAREVHGIHLDITERKRAEEELESIRRHLELAVEGAQLGVWSYNPVTRSAWFSDRSRDLLGLKDNFLPDATSVRECIHPDDWERLVGPQFRHFPDQPVGIEYRTLRPDGEERWVYSLGAAALDEAGTMQSVHGIHFDITDRKRAEEELARSRDALVQSEKLAALGALLAGVSHELNNPLAAIVGQAEMLAEDAQGTPMEQRANRISAAAERCARIVQTFLAMARQRERQLGQVNLNDIIASALELTDYSLRTSGIAVRVNFGSGLPPVEGDRDQLHQVLVNLIVNAQQAMEKGEAFEKVLTIRTSVNQAGRVLVDVTDTGPGVPEAMRRRIFEPFFTTKRQGQGGGGTGIGLSFSQGIVEAHGGTISVQPSRRGAHFRIELPAAAGQPVTVVPQMEVVIAEAAPSLRRCLIVEDEPDVADTLRELIAREGFEVTVAANGSEALHAIDRNAFDVLLSDLRMPQLSGAELHERLSETHPELVQRMAFVTGDTMGDRMGEFARSCSRPVLEKPFTRAGVRALLAALINPGA
ncbi:PAS domain-containing hybrid sensor histidine kinase/response regulator [Sphingosinicella sp. CPCC 101087]|uniref:PAS domain-containing hybrid sensor histidine kinase/response regulator n=1 Tax=Sphingosinicella sp. CPCC 101087 TaxID=2497754 RepID=UPI00101D7741|nr:PAS domain-containing hybrid sensor histidine kinase/response regulator [Sphingosinicella sp. CPCC 101087]